MTPALTDQAAAQAATLVRTAIANEANVARLISFAEEGVTAIEWVSVLDDVTTDECLGLDGLQWLMPDDPLDFENYIPIGHDIPFPGPVAHWSCRSSQIPVTEEGAGSDIFNPSEHNPMKGT
jgi:hypothetical protein